MIALVQRLIEWWTATRAGRSLARYGQARGSLLARGMTFSALFSLFAAVYVLFVVFGIWFEASPSLRDGVLSMLASAIPGLIDTGEGGAIDATALFNVPALSISGALVLALLINTASGWLGAFREGVRGVFGMDKPQRSVFVIWAFDLLALLGLAILILISVTLSIAASRILAIVLGWFGADEAIAGPTLTIAALGLALVIDTVVLFLLYRFQAGAPVPAPQLWLGSLVGAVGYGVLKYVGANLLTGTGNNPLLSSFAVIIGLLIWCNLMMQWLLLLAAWLAEGARTDTDDPRSEPAHPPLPDASPRG